MPVTLVENSAYANYIQVGVVGYPADGTLLFQAAVRPDFKGCVFPTIEMDRAVARNIYGLNSGTTYYIRCRVKRASGGLEPWSNTLVARTLDSGTRNTAPQPIMIEPAVLVVPEHILNVTANFPVAGFKAENLLHPGPTGWENVVAASADPHTLLFETGKVPIDTLALLNTNVQENVTITIQAGNTTDVADYVVAAQPFRASQNLPGRPGYHGFWELPAPQTFRYWKLSFGGSNFYNLHAQHLVAGLARKTKNHSVDKTEQGTDLGVFERTSDGQPVMQKGFRGRRVDFDISVVSEAEYDRAYGDLDWKVGQTDPVLVVPNSKRNAFFHDRILYGNLRGGRTTNPASPYYSRTFTVESII